MLTEIQKIILTCLLGPEDKTAFARFRKNAKEREASKERYRKDPEKSRGKSREKQRVRKAKNPEKFAAKERERYLSDPEAAKARQQKNYWKDPEACIKKATAYFHEHRLEINERLRFKYATDKNYKIAKVLRSRMIGAIKKAKGGKTSCAMELLGCPWVWAEVHLESLFKPGMTWANHGPVWHIDHIRPCASFNLTDPEQQRICFYWTNLQPLFAEENLKKGDKYVL